MEQKVNNPACFGVIDGGDELTHHGILGQKWGVRRGTSYPLDYDQHSEIQKKGLSAKFAERKEVKKKAEAAAKRKATIAKKKKASEAEAKQKAKAEKKIARKEARIEKKAAKEAAWKKQIIDDGDVDALNSMKKKDLRKFTNEEIRAAEIRYKQINELNNATIDATIERVSKIADKTRRVADIATNAATMTSKGVEVWNTVAKINNTLSGKKMKIIGEKEDNNKYEVTETRKDENGNFINVKYKVDDAAKNKLNKQFSGVNGPKDSTSPEKPKKSFTESASKVIGKIKTSKEEQKTKESGLKPKYDESGNKTQTSSAQEGLNRLKEINDMSPSQKRLHDSRSNVSSNDASSAVKWLQDYNKEEENKAKRKKQ